MTLRARLVVAAGACLLVVIAAFVGIAQRQEQVLLDQLDTQLTVVAERVSTLASELPTSASGPASQSGEFYIGALTNGDLITYVAPVSRPELVPDRDELQGAPRNVPVTVRASDNTIHMRVIVQDIGDLVVVAGQSTEPIDDAIRSLRVSGLVAVGAIGVVALVVGWWVDRLSIRPIRTASEVADAITSGRRGERVPDSPGNTEAAALGTAMNLMLDTTEETEARLRSFVADASHELRTPLTTLRGYADMHRQGLLGSPEAVDDAMRRIRGEAKRMSTIVEHLFLLANLDEGAIPIDPALVDVSQLLADIAADARIVHPERTIVVAAPVGVEATADRERLVQLVSILVTNALTHTPASAALTLGAVRGTGGLAITVADEGPGIPPEHLNRIFDRFYRVNQGRQRTHGGSGLGLAIAQSIASAHGGALQAESIVGQGSTFTFSFPDTPNDSMQSSAASSRTD